MKTAIVPNSETLTTLMKVSAELTLALEDYERECRTQMVGELKRAETDALKCFEELCPGLDPRVYRAAQLAIAEGIHQASSYQAAYVGIHERTLGLTGSSAPAEQAKIANTTYGSLIAEYWNKVNG